MSDAQALIAEVEAEMARVTPGPWMWAVLAQKYLPRLVAELRAAEAREAGLAVEVKHLDNDRKFFRSIASKVDSLMQVHQEHAQDQRARAAHWRAVAKGAAPAHVWDDSEDADMAADRAAFDAELSAFVNRGRDD